MSPRDIATKQIEAMKAAARKVWQEHEDQIPAEDRKEWRGLCWRHVLNHFAKLEGK